MPSKMLLWSHVEQQQATDRIHALMAEGMSSGKAIAQVAAEIRANCQSSQGYAVFDEEE